MLIQDVTRELAESFGMERPHGALIAKVLPNSPAESSGFEVGDVVLRFDGQEVVFSSDLPPIVGNSAIGSRVPVDIMRRGKKKTLKVKIEKLPEQGEIAQTNKKSSESSVNKLNIIVKDLSDAEREQLDLTDHGIRVEKVEAGVANDAGLRAGDLILLLNNTRIKDTAHFLKVLKGLPENKSIPVLVQRRGNPIFLAIKMPGSK